MPNCCTSCFANSSIARFVRQNGDSGSCDYCGSSRANVLDVEELAPYLRERLKAAYKNNENSISHWSVGGKTVREIFDEEEVFSERSYAIRSDERLFIDLMKPYEIDIPGGDSDELEGGDAELVERDDYHDEYDNVFTFSWKVFKHQVMHFSRFFELKSVAGPSRNLLRPISSFFKALTHDLEPGAVLWRARPDYDELKDDYAEMAQEIGPAPPERSRHSRMSPPGISYLYCAEDIETAVAEVRPSIGSKILLGRFILEKRLKILDLTRLPKLRTRGVFSLKYVPTKRFMHSFLADFIEEVSKHVDDRDSQVEYVPTQALCEHIRAEGFDGVRFNSSLHEGGINYTLFCGPTWDNYRLYMEASIDFTSLYAKSFDLLDQYLDWLRLVEARVATTRLYERFHAPERCQSRQFTPHDHASRPIFAAT